MVTGQGFKPSGCTRKRICLHIRKGVDSFVRKLFDNGSILY